MNRLYRALPEDELIRHPLDSMTLIFHKRSGITHVVSEPVPAILDVMGLEQLDAKTVAEKLDDSFQLEGETDVESIVLARLEELVSLGLVERV